MENDYIQCSFTYEEKELLDKLLGERYEYIDAKLKYYKKDGWRRKRLEQEIPLLYSIMEKVSGFDLSQLPDKVDTRR